MRSKGNYVVRQHEQRPIYLKSMWDTLERVPEIAQRPKVPLKYKRYIKLLL